MNKSWRCVRSEPGPDLKLFKGRFDYMLNPRNGKTVKMIILEAQDSANIVALTPEEEMLFVKQYRFGLEVETYELPGGMVDPGENHRIAAHRELREETGYSGSKWTYLGKIGSNPVFMDSYIHHWLVTGVVKTDELKLDEGEAIELVKIPVQEVREKLLNGFFLHPHTIGALVLFFGNHKTLF